jgi:hypothetical protein
VRTVDKGIGDVIAITCKDTGATVQDVTPVAANDFHCRPWDGQPSGYFGADRHGATAHRQLDQPWLGPV